MLGDLIGEVVGDAVGNALGRGFAGRCRRRKLRRLQGGHPIRLRGYLVNPAAGPHASRGVVTIAPDRTITWRNRWPAGRPSIIYRMGTERGRPITFTLRSGTHEGIGWDVETPDGQQAQVILYGPASSSFLAGLDPKSRTARRMSRKR